MTGGGGGGGVAAGAAGAGVGGGGGGGGGAGQSTSALNVPFMPSWCGHQNRPLMWCGPGVDTTGALCHVPFEPEKEKPEIVATVSPSTSIVPATGLL